MPHNDNRRTSFGQRNTNSRPSSKDEKDVNNINQGIENKQGNTDANQGNNNATNQSHTNQPDSEQGTNTNNYSESTDGHSSQNNDVPNNATNRESSSSDRIRPEQDSSGTKNVPKNDSASSNLASADESTSKSSLGDKAKAFAGDKGNQQSALNVLSSDNKKEALKEEAKKLAKKELKKQAVANAKPMAVAGAKGAGVGAGAGASAFLFIKAMGLVTKAIKGLLSTAPAVFIQQAMNVATKLLSAVTGFVNGAINGVMSALKIGATVSGIAPTVIASTVMFSSVATGTIIATSGAAGGKVEEAAACVKPDDEDSESSSNAEGDDGVVAVGDYTVVGSEKYVIAEQLFDNFTKTNGWSGAGAAGGIGNAIRESGLNPKADNPSGGVHGLFQWSGWSSTINGDRWAQAPGGKVDTVENQIALLNKELKMAYYKPVLTHVGKATDYKVAAGNFAKYFEGLSGGSEDKQFNPTVTFAGAKWAYETFGGANINADESILSGASEENDEIKVTEDKKKDDCDDSTSTGGKGAEDGTGEYTASSVKPYIPKDLPKDLQKYAYDPKDVGLAYGSATGWGKPGGQCVHLASSYFKAIWGISETPFGNGNELAKNWSNLIKGELSNTPSKGAITGIAGNVPGISTAPYGHTNVVQHVFANGDILVVEQNYPGVSGDGGGTGPYTWHYSVIPKKVYTQYNFDFFVPDKKKYKLNMGKNTIS